MGMNKSVWCEYPSELHEVLVKCADELGLSFAEFQRSCVLTIYSNLKDNEVFIQPTPYHKIKKLILKVKEGKNGK